MLSSTSSLVFDVESVLSTALLPLRSLPAGSADQGESGPFVSSLVWFLPLPRLVDESSDSRGIMVVCLD